MTNAPTHSVLMMSDAEIPASENVRKLKDDGLVFKWTDEIVAARRS
jgi:hypothetical protein